MAMKASKRGMDRARFYAVLRKRSSGVFGTSLSQRQVDGVEGILNAFVSHGDGRDKTLAYCLGTAYGESRCLPVREGFKSSDAAARAYVQRNYGRKGKTWYCWPAGPYGHVYYGRGYPQLTWLDNYAGSSADAGVDLVKNPDAMLVPEISARVLIKGIIDGRWNGRGKGIAHYLPTGGMDDMKGARRTVNVTDRWETFADYYSAFLKAIREAGGVPVTDTKSGKPISVPEPRQTEPKSPPFGKASFWSWLFDMIGKILRGGK